VFRTSDKAIAVATDLTPHPLIIQYRDIGEDVTDLFARGYSLALVALDVLTMASGENLVDVIAVVEINLEIISLICILCLNQSGEAGNNGDLEIFARRLTPLATCLKQRSGILYRPRETKNVIFCNSLIT
jgi:hypothetical protein